MKITNKFNLPSFLYERLAKDYYKGGKMNENTFSATEILNSPTYIWLKKRHAHEVEVDVMSLLYSVQGSIAHLLMDQGTDVEDALGDEERLKYKYGDLTLSGGFDRYDAEGHLWDFKYTNVWSEIYKDKYPKWEQQLNIYAFLLRQIGFEPKLATIIELFRDWSIGQYQKNQPYPLPIELIDFPIWDEEKQRKFIHNRLDYIDSFRHLSDEQLPPCSMEDRYQKPTRWAAVKKGNKRASSVLDSRDEAIEYIAKALGYKIDKNMTDEELTRKIGQYFNIEERPSVPNKCIDRVLSKDGTIVNITYCPYNQWCPWWQKNKEKYS